MRARIIIAQPKDMPIRFVLDTTLGELRTMLDQLGDTGDGTYELGNLRFAISSTLSKAEAVFLSEEIPVGFSA